MKQLADNNIIGARSAIFVHSLFRSGSTYFYNALKRSGVFHVYHEPMHEVIAALPNSWSDLVGRNEQLKATLRHDFLKGGYFDEYAHLLPSIKKHFKSNLSFDLYFMGAADGSVELKTYIDLLIDGAHKAPVLQCTRTLGRVSWLKENYHSKHVFLLRNPWDQWYSYKVDSYIATTPRLIYSQQNLPDVLGAVMASRNLLPLPGADTQAKLEYGYGHPIPPDADYCLFFGLWVYSFITAKRSCDVFVDMDETSSNNDYRETVLRELATIGIKSVNLSDSQLHRAVFTEREKSFYQVIEDQVLEIFRQSNLYADDLNAVRDYVRQQRHIVFLPGKCGLADEVNALEDAARMRELLLATTQNHATVMASLTLAVAERDRQIASLKQAVNDRDGQIGGFAQTAAERDRQIASLSQAVKDRDGQIGGYTQTVAERDGQIASLNQAVHDRDGQIGGLMQTVAERDHRIACLNQAVNDRDGQIDDLTQTVAERDGRIASLNQAVNDRDGQIASLTQIVTEREIAIHALQHSTSWQMTKPLRTLKNTFTWKKPVPREKEHPLSNAPGAEAFFTICSKNFLAHARVLRESVRPLYPDTKFYVVLCDRLDGSLDVANEPFELVHLENLGLPDLEGMAKRYNITEFNTAVKPFAFDHLMEKHGFGSVVYLDPDLFFVSKMEELDAMLAEGAEAVLTPHILQPAEHDEVHDGKMLLFGIYNLGFLALRNTPSVRTFLAWWGRRLERDCVIRLEEGLFVDQKWADLLPAFVPGTRIIHHAGYNVAYWNLPQRKITKTNNQWFANQSALRFVHFSGNRLDDTKIFSRHSQQVTVESIGDLRELLELYREKVYEQGHAFYRTLPYAYSWNGEAGVNLHTPKSLDLAVTEAPVAPTQTPGAILPTQSAASRNFIARKIAVLSRALPLATRLSGGLVPFSRRAWRAYRTHGWHYVKTKAVELSAYRAPPSAPSSSTAASPVTSNSLRLLYLDWAIPKPDQDAASVTAALLMKIFDSLGYKVTFLPCGLKYEEGYFEQLVAANVETLVYPHVTSVDEWLVANAKHFDVCIMARGPVVWPYLRTLKEHAPQLKLIFNTVDLHYLRELRQAQLAKNEGALEAANATRRQEYDLIGNCDLTILLSSDELYTVREAAPEAALAVLPVVFDDIPGASTSPDGRKDILFIGSFPHQPNIDAVIYFSEEIFPLIQKRIPDIRFKVVGSNPPDSILRLAKNPGIQILGFVKDLEPVFAGVRLSVAPLRFGAGIKGKIASSLCYGVPCIATPIAVEGMGLESGKNVLVGNTPQAFANAVCNAYQDTELWCRLSEAGFHFALDNYSVETIRARVRQMLWSVSEGWRPVSNAYEINSWNSFEKHRERLGDTYLKRVNREQALLPTDGAESFHTKGFCCVCGKEAQFLTSFMYSTGLTPDGRLMPNWREHMQCGHCGLVNRMRAALNVLHTMAPPQKDSRIYITEHLTATYRWLKTRYPNLQGSEYFGPNHHPGVIVDGIRHEDVMCLGFADSSFDRILSFDVLEHVPYPDKAFREIFRTLDKDGVFIFSVPFSADSESDIIRARIDADGLIEYLMPKEMHGNPVDPEGGALCFRYFGWEMLDQLREIGFRKARCLAYWSELQGYLGKEQYLFIAEK